MPVHIYIDIRSLLNLVGLHLRTLSVLMKLLKFLKLEY